MSKSPTDALWHYLALSGVCYDGLEGKEQAEIERLWYRRYLSDYGELYRPDLLKKYMIEIYQIDPVRARQFVDEYERLTAVFISCPS